MEKVPEKGSAEGEPGRNGKALPEAILEKLKQIPRPTRTFLGGLGLLTALSGGQELAAQDARKAPAFPSANAESRIPPSAREALEKHFQISVAEKETRRFVVVVTTDPKNFERILLGSNLLTTVTILTSAPPEARGLFIPTKEARTKELQDFLQKQKQKLGSVEFAIDSTEVKSSLGQEDYYKIMETAFGESLNKILAVIDTVKVIDSPEEERKIPEEYDIEGFRAARHIRRGGYSIIEVEQTYLREEGSLWSEARLIFHELGHAFDPASPYGIFNDGIAKKALKKMGRAPVYWRMTMIEDMTARNDTGETIFYYPQQIKDSDIRATEDFAESFGSYFMNAKWLFESSPNRFMAIDEMVRSYLGDSDWNIFERSEKLRAYIERVQKDSRESFYATAGQIAQNIR
ncbi:MAG: hypothetical protein A2939_05610 [Parcubacteria group bacterium RIFCSPLOWO2_01_FULL_48_18]|nr:MAG: hypothetical protein A3J67_00990 [Parcubacteria group bacterium RIFCSPHIGHO2_02_FULL_48_10b]OHB22572.1 MAG: hypothetical protein A2939_05610 [Parcubacteria group bacterium RIFCSPLOWO2_01_FULL_48_18]